jgi:hypothetical protein
MLLLAQRRQEVLRLPEAREGKNMTVKWSFSGLKDYEQCARKFHEVKVLKRYPKQDNAANLYGTAAHKVAEDYIQLGTPLAKDFLYMKPILDSLRAMPGDKLCEWKMGLKADLTACDFDAPDYWVRGIADLAILAPDRTTARCFDYKFGNDRYADTDQLLLMALMIFAHFPTVQSVSGGLLFVMKGTLSKHRITRDQIEKSWWRWRERVAKLEASHINNHWPEKRSGLCKKYCPVLDCPYNG